MLVAVSGGGGGGGGAPSSAARRIGKNEAVTVKLEKFATQFTYFFFLDSYYH
ncbi:hypothetical protein [Oryza sativa Japonica Group]|uniref:Uncharacterized protein P0674H09.16 n=1 Tax=Oryza sativa subsp. japonica TaxID=39947 RepID=Q5N8N0_ORYSJ|nr:hypothetical protein [Oryza sativa Japonica Group]